MKRHSDDLGVSLPSKRAHVECSKLFIGGLSHNTTTVVLKEHFAQIGRVDFCSVTQNPDGSSKGCGMVNYANPEDAQRAVQLLNESLLDGRHIMVKLDLSGDLRHPTLTSSLRPAASPALPVGLLQPQQLHRQSAGVTLPAEQITRVFVGSLDYRTTWQTVKDLFKQAGDVEFASVLEHPDGSSKGVGMVNYFTHEEAMLAVDMFDGYELDGRRITVKLDVDGRFKERPPPKSRGELGASRLPLQEPEGGRLQAEYHSLPPEEISRVFVGNLNYDTNWQALKDHFTQIGEIEFASVLLNPDRTSKGCGMVNFTSHEDAMRAVDLLHNSELDNRAITVKLDVDGRFKERPPPRAGPPKVQVPRGGHGARGGGLPPHGSSHGHGSGSSSSSSSSHLGASSSARALPFGAISAAASRGGAPETDVAALVSGVSTLAQSPAGMDMLAVLGKFAQTPGASNVDWTLLISSVAQAIR